MKVRFLPYFIESKALDDYLLVAEDFFKNLPSTCPFCGWIGDVPLQHGYTNDWICPVLYFAEHIKKLKSGATVTFEDDIENFPDTNYPRDRT